MFEIDNVELERISSDYDIPIDTVVKYAEVLGCCELIQDEDTLLRALEETISMCSSFADRKRALTKALTVMSLPGGSDDIREEVKNMLEAYKQAEKERGGKSL